MSDVQNIAIVIGSLRNGSLTGKVAKQLVDHAPSEMKCSLIGIDMPLYNQDLDSDPPADWRQFRAAIAQADGVIFVSPEYNRSMPGTVKNAIDVGSRPYIKRVLIGKPAAVVSQSPSPTGPTLSNHAIRQSLVFLDMPVMPQPELYIHNSMALFDQAGGYSAGDGGPPFAPFMAAFSRWVARMAR